MSDERPVVGICTTLVRADWGAWKQREAALLAVSYIDAIQRAGGMAVMIPPDDRLEQNPDEILDLLDGLVLAGGNDIDPVAVRRAIGKRLTSSRMGARSASTKAMCSI